mgnify:CR=1 FL=1
MVPWRRRTVDGRPEGSADSNQVSMDDQEGTVDQPRCRESRNARPTRVRTGLAAELSGMIDMSQA